VHRITTWYRLLGIVSKIFYTFVVSSGSREGKSEQWLGCELNNRDTCNSIPCRKLPNRICGPPNLSFNGYWWLFLGGKAVETWRPLSSNSEFTINWSHTFTFAPPHPPTCLCSVYRNDFISPMHATNLANLHTTCYNVLPHLSVTVLVCKFVLQKSVFGSRSTDLLARLWFS